MLPESLFKRSADNIPIAYFNAENSTQDGASNLP
jgi:hypothetical protein